MVLILEFYSNQAKLQITLTNPILGEDVMRAGLFYESAS